MVNVMRDSRLLKLLALFYSALKYEGKTAFDSIECVMCDCQGDCLLISYDVTYSDLSCRLIFHNSFKMCGQGVCYCNLCKEIVILCNVRRTNDIWENTGLLHLS